MQFDDFIKDLEHKTQSSEGIFFLYANQRLSSQRNIIVQDLWIKSKEPGMDPPKLYSEALKLFKNMRWLDQMVESTEKINNGSVDPAKEINTLISLKDKLGLKGVILYGSSKLYGDWNKRMNTLDQNTAEVLKIQLAHSYLNNTNVPVEIRKFVKENPEYRGVYQFAFGENVKIDASVEEMIQQEPDIQKSILLVKILSESEEIKNKTDFIIKNIEHWEKEKEKEKEKQKEQLERQRGIQEARNVQFGVIQFIQLVDPAFAQDVGHVSETVFSVFQTISDLQVPDIPTSQVFGLVMGGLGSVISLANYFMTKDQPSDCQLIMEAMREQTIFLASKIDKLHEHLDLVKKDILLGLEEISKQLEFVYIKLSSKLDVVIQSLKEIKEEIKDEKENSLKRYMHAVDIAQAGRLNDFSKEISKCVRNRIKNPTLEVIDECLLYVVYFSTDLASKDDAFQLKELLPNFSYDSQSLFKSNFNPLMKEFSLKHQGREQISNPFLWGKGAKAFVEIVQRWESSFDERDKKSLTQNYMHPLINEGFLIKERLSSLLYDVSGKNKIRINDTNLKNLFNAYAMTLLKLEEELHMQKTKDGILPFKSIDDQPSFTEDIFFSMIPKIFQLAHHLGLGKLKITFENPRYKNVLVEMGEKKTPDGNLYEKFKGYAFLVFDLVIRFEIENNNLRLAQFSIRSPERIEMSELQHVREWKTNSDRWEPQNQYANPEERSPEYKLSSLRKQSPEVILNYIQKNISEKLEIITKDFITDDTQTRKIIEHIVENKNTDFIPFDGKKSSINKYKDKQWENLSEKVLNEKFNPLIQEVYRKLDELKEDVIASFMKSKPNEIEAEAIYNEMYRNKSLLQALLFLGLHKSMTGNDINLMSYFNSLSQDRLIDYKLLLERYDDETKFHTDETKPLPKLPIDLKNVCDSGLRRLKDLGCLLMGTQMNTLFPNYFEDKKLREKALALDLKCEENKVGLLQERISANETPNFLMEPLVNLRALKDEIEDDQNPGTGRAFK